MWRRHLLQSQLHYYQRRPVPAQHKRIATSWVMEWGIQHHLAGSVGTINTAIHRLQRESGEVDSVTNLTGVTTLFLQSTTIMGKYAKSFYITIIRSLLGEWKGTVRKIKTEQNNSMEHIFIHPTHEDGQRTVQSSSVFSPNVLRPTICLLNGFLLNLVYESIVNIVGLSYVGL
jgi:hypothetical protein